MYHTLKGTEKHGAQGHPIVERKKERQIDVTTEEDWQVLLASGWLNTEEKM